ncbi:hypothetical protein CYFUS_003709 [Cystobacter fuscus]|uniref:Uncharacterized protein n=1 Tax=Cystobacter fuscus TaxID=43 RepID=A0A250J2T9_9BACT|nr:hypothetical protein [Cystobacter fuscus]ATB38275.1 hypothetical protein CYFUS_003709 [Cystobacter fuscus]
MPHVIVKLYDVSPEHWVDVDGGYTVRWVVPRETQALTEEKQP